MIGLDGHGPSRYRVTCVDPMAGCDICRCRSCVESGERPHIRIPTPKSISSNRLKSQIHFMLFSSFSSPRQNSYAVRRPYTSVHPTRSIPTHQLSPPHTPTIPEPIPCHTPHPAYTPHPSRVFHQFMAHPWLFRLFWSHRTSVSNGISGSGSSFTEFTAAKACA